MAERLGRGLQIRLQRFNSASHLQQKTPRLRGFSFIRPFYDADPTRLFIATTRRSRRKLESSLVVVSGNRHDRISNYDGVPAQTLEDAIRVSRGYVRMIGVYMR